jgi:hypothetical protein
MPGSTRGNLVWHPTTNPAACPAFFGAPGADAWICCWTNASCSRPGSSPSRSLTAAAKRTMPAGSGARKDSGDLIINAVPNAGNPQKVQRYPWDCDLSETGRARDEPDGRKPLPCCSHCRAPGIVQRLTLNRTRGPPARMQPITGHGEWFCRRLFWRVVDHLDYLLTLAWLRILDALAGPLPETPADRQRQRDRERIKRAFPEIEP